jgi:hypothetical protein
MTFKKLLAISIPVLFLFSACERTDELLDENHQWNYVDTTTNGFLKVVHAYAPLGPSVVANSGPKVMVFVDGKRWLRDSLAYNATFPAPSGAYAVIPAGSHNVQFILSRSGTVPQSAGDTVFKTTANIAAGKYYTAFLADSAQSPGVFLVNDNFVIPNQGNYLVRFANLVANPNQRYDIYADSLQRMVATNIGYREISDFVALPVPRITENFTVRLAGTTTVVYTLPAFAPVSQRAYTLYNRGRVGTAGRTPSLTFYTNR